VIQKHLDDFGLEQDFGTYGKIGGLSGGQKVKLVLAAAMWNQPHLLVLDEPTNFLDREALGGVIMISHDREFMQELCTETWLVDIVEEEMVEGKIVRKKKAKRVEEASDEAKLMNAGGNMNKAKEHTVELDFWGKPLSKAEIRRRAKLAKAESKKK
ncbi:elongation factor, partial [Nannochloropsis oceanica]